MAVRSGGDLDSLTNLECNHCHSRLTADNGPLSSGVYSGTCTVCNKPLKFWSLVDPVDQVTFQVNGVKYKISNPDPGMSLNEWIRSQPQLKGTKVMCREGGCGSCTVVVTRTDLHTGKPVTFTVNSCLYPLCGADGISVMTVEGIGSQEDGFHPIQERLAEHNGSQCGYCSPGMVMNMYGLLKQNATPSKQEVEDHFDGNICRCTGYRPILDAMKSFSKDENPIDIEELTKKCKGDCPTCPRKSVALPNSSDDALWFNPTTLKDLFTLVAKYVSEKIRIVGGNTGKGVFADDGPFNVYIDVNNIADLKITKAMDDSLLVGGSVSLTNLIDLFDQNAPLYPPYAVLADHIRKVANVPVRNVGTVAGNLMLTHDHPDFPSDIFTILEAVGTKAFIVDSKTQKPLQYSLMDFLSLDMTGKIILMVSIPQSSSKSSAFVRTYKVMPRAQNAHAYVNAGFATTFDKTSMTGTSYRIVYGGIGPYATHAPKTEAFMEGKSITDPKTLQGALAILDKELVPDTPKVSASPVYRKSLGLGLFYKFYLSMLGDKASSRVKSAAVPFVRPVSSGTQAYDTHPDKFPLTKPMTKLAAKLQTSGEAVYTDDIPSQGGELFAAFVLAAQGNCKLDSIDASKAKSMPGVVDFLTSSNIPSKGINSFSFKDLQPEEIFCSGDVLYAGQAVGLIIADTQRHADEAAWAVTVTYKEIKPQILTIPQAIAAKSFFPATSKPLVVGDAEAAIKSSSKVISGQIAMGTQHHIHMETQVCLCVPEEDGLTVHCATQWVDLLQGVVARVLGWPSNKINVNVKRCGGGYGGKATRSVQAAAALAIAVNKLRRPVRIMMNFHTNMRMVGKRAPFMASYKVGVSDSGLLNGIDMTYYADYGCSSNDTDVNGAMSWCDNVYRCANWKVTPISCKTNLASNTWCRSPSSIQAIFIMESVMEHVAKALNKTPEEVRQINLYKKGQTCPTGEALTYCNIDTLWSDLKTSSDFAKRKAAIDAFNKANRWRKRGISLVPLRFGIHWADERFLSLVSIFHEDGSVSVSHAGVEVGQGINTKVAQVAGYCLKIPVDIIQIKSTSNLTTPNSDPTGGSVTSELCCESVILSCSILNKRMEPIRQKYKPSTWLELVQKCYKEGVNLTANAMFQGKSKEPLVYSTYGVTCTEVEIDVLTGERDIIRTDILYDCGESMNPELDVGQVEGAFVMGLGYWMTEKGIYDSKTGEELTYSTWEYKPPSSKDIPIDFRINLLKNAPNPRGILRSKAVGEPPMCMSCSALFAIKHAVQNARAEISKDANYFPLDGPAMVEDTQLACLVDYSQFTL